MVNCASFVEKIMQPIQIKVFGKVQGVWYRKSTQLKAQELGLQGTVQNKPDGCVWIEATGTTNQLNTLISWCKIGPEHALVERIEVHPCKKKDMEGFVVIR